MFLSVNVSGPTPVFVSGPTPQAYSVCTHGRVHLWIPKKPVPCPFMWPCQTSFHRRPHNGMSSFVFFPLSQKLGARTLLNSKTKIVIPQCHRRGRANVISQSVDLRFLHTFSSGQLLWDSKFHLLLAQPTPKQKPRLRRWADLSGCSVYADKDIFSTPWTRLEWPGGRRGRGVNRTSEEGVKGLLLTKSSGWEEDRLEGQRVGCQKTWDGEGGPERGPKGMQWAVLGGRASLHLCPSSLTPTGPSPTLEDQTATSKMGEVSKRQETKRAW